MKCLITFIINFLKRLKLKETTVHVEDLEKDQKEVKRELVKMKVEINEQKTKNRRRE